MRSAWLLWGTCGESYKSCSIAVRCANLFGGGSAVVHSPRASVGRDAMDSLEFHAAGRGNSDHDSIDDITITLAKFSNDALNNAKGSKQQRI